MALQEPLSGLARSSSDKTRPPAVLYIAGAGRSGSTLLEGLLATTPGFVAVGEMRYFWQRAVLEDTLCSCGVPFSACDFWTAVMRRAFGDSENVDAQLMLARTSRIDRIRHIPWLALPWLRTAGSRQMLATYVPTLVRLYRGILDESGATIAIDSSKDPSYAFLLAAIREIDLCVVHLVRDSRGVAYSWQRVRRRPEIHWEAAYMRRFAPAQTASEWNRTNLFFEFMARGSARYLRLHYEDLATDPGQALAKIRRTFASVEPAFAEIGQVGESGSVPSRHSVSGNPVRFESGIPAIKPDLEWHSKMPTRERRSVVIRTAPLLLRYGYLTSRRPGKITK